MLHNDQSYWVAQYYSYCVTQSRTRTEHSVKQSHSGKLAHRNLIARGAAAHYGVVQARPPVSALIVGPASMSGDKRLLRRGRC